MNKLIQGINVVNPEIILSNDKLSILTAEWDDFKAIYPNYFLRMQFTDFKGYILARNNHSFSYLLSEIEEAF